VKPQRIVIIALAACLSFAAVGCGSDSDSTTSTTTSKEAVCAARKKLETSAKALGNSGTFTDGGASVKQALSKVKKDLDALGTSVKADLRPDVDAVKQAIDDLQSALSDIGDGSITKNLQSLGTSIAKVGSTTGALTESLNAECPS
jgi:hypothetical protein